MVEIIDIDEAKHFDEDLFPDHEREAARVCPECWQVRSLTGTCGCIG